MQDSTSNRRSTDTTPLSEAFAPTTGANLQATVGTVTQGKFGNVGIAQAIKSGALTPEDALKMADEHFAKTGRKFTLPSVESRRAKYEQDEQERQNFEAFKQPFLDPNFSPNGDFWLGPGLNLLGGKSGQGKTTTCANILAGFVSYRPDTTAVVVLNEEKGGTLLQRTACVLLKKSFAKFFHKGMFPAEEDEVRRLAEELVSRIVIVDSDPYDTNCLEDVKTIITGAPSAGANLVLLDYYQNVNYSRDNPGMEPFKILKELGFFLKDYGRSNTVPIGVFCQLKTEGDTKDFKDRVENDKTIFNHAYNALEIKPDKETGLTEFIVWKQRFAYEQFYKVVLKYEGGRYVQQESVGL